MAVDCRPKQHLYIVSCQVLGHSNKRSNKSNRLSTAVDTRGEQQTGWPSLSTHRRARLVGLKDPKTQQLDAATEMGCGKLCVCLTLMALRKARERRLTSPESTAAYIMSIQPLKVAWKQEGGGQSASVRVPGPVSSKVAQQERAGR